MRFEYVEDEFTSDLKADFKEMIEDCKDLSIKDILSAFMLFLAVGEFCFMLLVLY